VDADSELTAKKNSHVSQIFQNHDLLKKKEGETHYFATLIKESNKNINQ